MPLSSSGTLVCRCWRDRPFSFAHRASRHVYAMPGGRVKWQRVSKTVAGFRFHVTICNKE
jgi:hypothetical protein